jgi:hypothetical protein
MRSKRVRNSDGRHHPALGPAKIRVRVIGCQRARKVANSSRNGRHNLPRRAKARRCQFSPPLRSARRLNCRPSSWRRRGAGRALHPRGSIRFGYVTQPSRLARSDRQRGRASRRGHKSPGRPAYRHCPPDKYLLRISAGRYP